MSSGEEAKKATFVGKTKFMSKFEMKINLTVKQVTTATTATGMTS